jgi:hypothetical protein
MSRAANQRIVYALKNGRLVPKSEVLGKVAGASAPVTVEGFADEPDAAEPDADQVTAGVDVHDGGIEVSAVDHKRRGRPPKVREEESSDDVSAFQIED